MSIETKARAISAEIVRLLRAEREKQKLSKYAVSRRSGLSQQTLGNMERGSKSPTFETMWRLATALDLKFPNVVKQAEAVVKKD